MHRDHSAQIDTLSQIVDLVVCAAVFLFVLSVPGMLAFASADGTALEGVLRLSSLRLLGLGFTSTLIWPIVLRVLDLYALQRRRLFGRVRYRLVAAGLGLTLFQFVMAQLLSTPTTIFFPLICGGIQVTALLGLRAMVGAGVRILQAKERAPRNVIIVGSGPRAEYVQGIIGKNPAWALHIIGFVDDTMPPEGPSVPHERIFKISDIESLLNDQVVDEVIVACPRSLLATMIPVVDSCSAAGIPITLLSDLFGDYLPPPQTTRFGTLPALSFAPVHHNAAMLGIKRGIDIVGSGLGLLLSMPIVAVAAIAIKSDSRGPVLFRQVRCGLNGRHFVVLKLRTMEINAEERRHDLTVLNEMDGPVFKIKKDPRTTKVGRILRRYSIDELPQFWNVFRGDMSLVGPRPPVPVEVAEYETFERRRLSMRPGLTCLWQVSGRNAIGFEGWVRLDLEYIDTWSLSNDLRILMRTLPAVLSGDGAS